MTAIRRSVGKRSAEHDFNLILCQFLWMSESKDDSLGGQGRKGHPGDTEGGQGWATQDGRPPDQCIVFYRQNVTYFQRLYIHCTCIIHVSLSALSAREGQVLAYLYELAFWWSICMTDFVRCTGLSLLAFPKSNICKVNAVHKSEATSGNAI